MARPPGATELLPPPAEGRTFTTSRRVRLSDTTVDGVARLDALARYVQDIASDDAREAMPASYLAWVVRRTVVEVSKFPVAEEIVRLTTWCSGYGSRWAERRTSLTGQAGGRMEAVMLWVAVDVTTEAPAALPQEFHDAYGVASQDRRVSARLLHDDPPDPGDRYPIAWRFRASDLDRMGHVNNAAFWVVFEELAGIGSARPGALHAELEYREPVEPDAALEVLTDQERRRTRLWLVTERPERDVKATFVLTR